MAGLPRHEDQVLSRHNRERRERRKRDRQVDYAAFYRVTRPIGSLQCGTERFVLIEPLLGGLNTEEDQMDFDREVCATGLKEYARAVNPGDYAYSGLTAMRNADFVIVREVRPGERTRAAVQTGPAEALAGVN